MSRKRNVAVEIQDEKEVEPAVSFQVFFQECLTKKLVKPWQEKEINAFFSDLGLTNKETSDKYRDALSKY